jgi:hypothetical protein
VVHGCERACFLRARRGPAAPHRTSPAGHVDAGLGALIPLRGRFYLTSELAVQTHFLSVEDDASSHALTPRFAVRGMLAFGAWR